MNKKVFLTTLLLITLLSSPAYAGIFTNSDSNVNSMYNRATAKAYAEKYAITANSGYFNYTNYGGDCTNFVSQVLFHGGIPEAKALAYWGATAWFYDGYEPPNRSHSWTGAHDFRYHWANVNNSGFNRAYQYKVYTYDSAAANFPTIYSDLWPGDVVQYVDSSGTTVHTQVVHSYSGGELYVAQHTSNKMNVPLKLTLQGKVGQAGWFVTYKIKQASY